MHSAALWADVRQRRREGRSRDFLERTALASADSRGSPFARQRPARPRGAGHACLRFVFLRLAEIGQAFGDLQDAMRQILKVLFREVLAVPVDLPFGDLIDFPLSDVNGIGLDGIEERRRLTERAGRFLEDAHHPAVFHPPGDIAYCIFECL